MITIEDFKIAAEKAFDEVHRVYGDIYPNFCNFFICDCDGPADTVPCIRTDFHLPCEIDSVSEWGDGLKNYVIPNDAVIVMEPLENGRICIHSKIRPIVVSHDKIWNIQLMSFQHSAELRFGPDARVSALETYITNQLSLFVRYVHDSLLMWAISDIRPAEPFTTFSIH